VEGAKWPDTRIRATLLHSVGTEAQRIFYTLTETGTTYNHAVTALRAHFVPKVNVIAERHKFRQRAQRHDETIAHVSALREMLVLCEFGNAEQDMLRDQIVEKAHSGRIRERLLLEDKLTLDKAIQIANQVETAAHNVAEFSNSEVPERDQRTTKKVRESLSKYEDVTDVIQINIWPIPHNALLQTKYANPGILPKCVVQNKNVK